MSSFTWDLETPELIAFGGGRGEDAYKFVWHLKNTEFDYRLWAKQVTEKLTANVDRNANLELARAIKNAIETKTTLYDNYKEQTLAAISRLYHLYATPNLSLYIAARQGIHWVVREAVLTGATIVHDVYGRPRVKESEKVERMKREKMLLTVEIHKNNELVRKTQQDIDASKYRGKQGGRRDELQAQWGLTLASTLQELADQELRLKELKQSLHEIMRKENQNIYDIEWSESGSGSTALHIAAQLGTPAHYQISKLLVQCGWNPATMDSAGRTPVDLALVRIASNSDGDGGDSMDRIASMLWEHRSSDEIPALPASYGRDNRPKPREIQYCASAWEVLLQRHPQPPNKDEDSDDEEDIFFHVLSAHHKAIRSREAIEAAERARLEKLGIVAAEELAFQTLGNNNKSNAAGDPILLSMPDGGEEGAKDPPFDEGKTAPAHVTPEAKDGNIEHDTKGTFKLLSVDEEENVATASPKPNTEMSKVAFQEKKKPKTKAVCMYNMEDSIPASEEQNLALCLAAYGLRDDIVNAAIINGDEIFYLYNAWGHWQCRKRLTPIHYDRTWCDSRGWTALHYLCSRKGPLIIENDNKGMEIGRALVNAGWNVNKFSVVGAGRCAVDIADRNKLGKIAVTLHTLMPAGHKSVVWKDKQSAARNMKTATRAATREENLMLCWCARGWTGGSGDLDSVYEDEPQRPPTPPAQFGQIIITPRSEEQDQGLPEDDDPFVIPAHEGPRACESLLQRQKRRQWLGHCLLAAVLHGHELYEEQGLFKCRMSRPAVTYDIEFEEENGFTALHTAALRGRRNIVGALVAAGWDPLKKIMRQSRFLYADAEQMAKFCGDETLRMGIEAVTDPQVNLIEFSMWMVRGKEREEEMRVAQELQRQRLAELEAARVARILKVVHKLGLPDQLDDAFIRFTNRTSRMEIADLTGITKEDLILCGLKPMAAGNISRKIENSPIIRKAIVARKKEEENRKQEIIEDAALVSDAGLEAHERT
eukprot:Stramenopile-MAST_4_protein_1096